MSISQRWIFFNGSQTCSGLNCLHNFRVCELCTTRIQVSQEAAPTFESNAAPSTARPHGFDNVYQFTTSSMLHNEYNKTPWIAWIVSTGSCEDAKDAVANGGVLASASRHGVVFCSKLKGISEAFLFFHEKHLPRQRQRPLLIPFACKCSPSFFVVLGDFEPNQPSVVSILSQQASSSSATAGPAVQPPSVAKWRRSKVIKISAAYPWNIPIRFARDSWRDSFHFKLWDCSRYRRWNHPTLKHSNLALRVKLQVFRPKADMTIHFSQSWGEDLVRYIDGERSKDYVVRDRHRAKGVQMEQTWADFKHTYAEPVQW